jgi:hypothetical protein
MCGWLNFVRIGTGVGRAHIVMREQHGPYFRGTDSPSQTDPQQ